jgi:predicted transcriptional regulator
MKMTVLEAISKEELLTRIMYHVEGLAYSRVKEIVNELVNMGVVAVEKPEGRDSRIKRVYRLTLKGETVLQNWGNLKDILHP